MECSHSLAAEQILIETGRKWRYIDKVPLSSRFYKVLFIDYTMDKQKQEKRAGMALQYPLLSASAIQIRSLFYFQQKIYITNTASYLDNSGFRGYNSI